MKTFRDLEVWQESMQLCRQIYEVTELLPDSEKYGLATQMRRAVTSVPSNIAEGWGRNSDGAYANFVRIAVGSVAELQTQVEIAKMMKMVPDENATHLIATCEVLMKRLNALAASISRRESKE